MGRGERALTRPTLEHRYIARIARDADLDHSPRALPWHRHTRVGDSDVSGNVARGQADVQQPPGAILGSANSESTHVAFSGEASLIGSFRLSKNVSVYGGYQFLYLDGLSLASNNLSRTSGLVPPPATTLNLRVNDNVYVHGAVLGLKVQW